MTDLKLYSHPVSANSHRVKLMLSLLGVEHDEVTVDLLKGEHFSPAFAALNPWGRLPVLKFGEAVFNESYAILIFAVREFGSKGLDGASTRGIAEAAGTAMSSITYHFGGKEGLYLAAAEHIAAADLVHRMCRDSSPEGRPLKRGVALEDACDFEQRGRLSRICRCWLYIGMKLGPRRNRSPLNTD